MEWNKARKIGHIEYTRYHETGEFVKILFAQGVPLDSEGYIARDPENHCDVWFMSEEFFLRNYTVID
jgi:hypothetical protein